MKNITLRCPKCGREQETELPGSGAPWTCAGCGTVYERIGASWDFRVVMINDESGWDADKFDRGYARLERFEDNYLHAEAAGIPRFIEEYRISRCKDVLSRWVVESNGPERRLLDVGCGHGWYGLELIQKWGFAGELLGVDVSPFNVNLYLKEMEKRGVTSIFALCANGEGLPFPDDFFDMAVFSEVLEHVENPTAVFKEIARVLKPGGQLFLSTPSGPMCAFWEGLFGLLRKLKHLVKGAGGSSEQPYDKPLSRRKILRCLEGTGLTIVQYRKGIFLPHESFLQFFPRWALRIMLVFAKALEAFGPFTQFLGLHHLVKLKVNDE